MPATGAEATGLDEVPKVVRAGTTGRLVIAPETVTVGVPTSSLHDLSGDADYILFTPILDFAVVNSVVSSESIGAVVVTTAEFADHARKMLHEAGIALVVHTGEELDAAGRWVVDHAGLTLLGQGAPVSAICSVLNRRNVAIYRRFGVEHLGYFRFKFCLFQLFTQEPHSYGDDARVEEYLYEQLVALGGQHWTSIRCVLSDPTSAELAEIGIDVPSEVNPDLGVRGPRQLHRWRAELAAVRRFLAEFDTPIKICAPFVSSTEEFAAFAALVAEAGIDRDRVELGFTLEIPALAEDLDDLFATMRVDFMAIGTSDLFALFNGVDRNNAALSVVPTSRANVSLLRRVVASAREHDVHTFVCGEVRRSEELMTELLQAGVGELICSARVEELTTVFRLSRAGQASIAG